MSFNRPKEPGKMSDGARSYTIPHRSKFYLPWVIEAEPPTWRDVWAILRRRYQPTLVLRIRLTTEGYSQILKDAWTGPRLQEQMYAASGLLVPIVKRDKGEDE